MRTIETKVFEFKELSPDTQEQIINNWELYPSWYDSTYEDAENIALKITEFDIDRNTINGEFTLSPFQCATLITDNHGKTCNTFLFADGYLASYAEISTRDANNDLTAEECNLMDKDLEDLGEEFLHYLLKEYLQMLKSDYDYQTSREAIVETIEANNYEFTEAGKMI